MPSPLDATYDALGQEIEQRMGGNPPDLLPVMGRLLAIPPQRFARADDAARFLHLLGFLSRQPGADIRKAWTWSTDVARPHPAAADVLALLAAVGDGLRQIDPAAADVIPTGELSALFRRAMAAGPDVATTFGRAGLFFLHQDEDAEAQRCLERAFELDPSSGFIARQLADLYDHAGRAADGLAVLERCLAAGSADPDLLWKAGLAAVALGRAASAASHFGALERADPGRAWVAYYRAVSLIDLGRFAEAALAIEREAGISKRPDALHVIAVRGAAAAGLDDLAGVRRHVDAAARLPLSSVDYLAPAGVVGCYTRLWAAVGKLEDGDTVVARLTERVLASGLTPLPFWVMTEPVRDGLTHYWVDVRQPLDPRWAAAGNALPNTDTWPAYGIRYGIMATDADDAARRALDWQQRSAPLPATVSAVTPDGPPLTDRPGVTRRGWPTATA